MAGYDARAIQNIEGLFDPDESLIVVSSWFDEKARYQKSRDIEWPGPHPFTLALTGRRMYVINLKFSFTGNRTKVQEHWSRRFEDFTRWQFDSVKDNKGTLKTYAFAFSGDDGHADESFNAHPEDAEPFIDAFTSAMTRISAVRAVPDVAEQLQALHSLFSEGVLTAEEFQRAKELFIGCPADAELKAERSLRNLKQLLDAGILTESEFRSKKWQVLSAQ
ncbi:MAG: hypothetical protein QG671_4504 [Actinomycetota bacterium]|jgi:hypothetical protein|nr:hypothetical protein [Actinomycetota bacterium]